MEMINSFLWSDGWVVRDDEAYYVAGVYAALFKVDLLTSKVTFVAEIPVDNIFAFRVNPRIKWIGDKLYLLPDYGTKLIVFDISSRSFEQIELTGEKEMPRIGIYKAWEVGDNLLMWAHGLQRLLKFHLRNEEIVEVASFDTPSDIIVTDVDFNRDTLYGIANDGNIYSANWVTGEKRSHTIENHMTIFQQIFWSGEKYFLFGGYRFFCTWDGENAHLNTYDIFPEDFGIIEKNGVLNTKAEEYDIPAFSSYVTVGKKIWLCPLQTNMIIFIDYETLESGKMEIIKQDADVHSNLLSSMGLFQYVKDGRYLGFYDFNTMSLMDIDTVEMTIKQKELLLNREFTSNLYKDCIFQEANPFDRFIFWEKVRGIANEQG